MKSKFIVCLVALGMIASLIAGCTPTTTSETSAAATSAAPATEAPTSAAAETSAAATEPSAAPVPNAVIPKFEDIQFPANLPAEIPMADSSLYGYDDLTAKYDIEILSHHYGVPTLPSDQDPVNKWLSQKFNMNITFTTLNNADLDTTVSTRFASADYPDITALNSGTAREMAFTFSDQSLLLDAKSIYPYMPQTCKFVTKNMVIWSTNKANGQIPFITKYGIQDGVWGFAIRKDWLTKFGMTEPKTKADLLAYAKACVEKDPDGNGKADTYFMSGAGGGKNWGMLGGFESMFGNPASHAENGALSHPYFNGVRKGYLSFLKELYDAKVFSPDWYTIDWETNKSYTMNDKLGMVWYPAGALYAEYTNAKNAKANNDLNFDVWEFYHDVPIENGKYNASGNPGYMVAFAASKFSDEGKVKRVAHMFDTMVLGGENYFQTIQGAVTEVFQAAGIQVDEPREMKYTDDKKAFYITNVKNAEAMPWKSGGGYMDQLGPWQVFGLSVSYQISDPNGADDWTSKYAKVTNDYAITVNGYDRWPNDALLVTLTGTAAEAQASNIDWIYAQEYAFATGARSLDDWDKYTNEWLGRGGKEIISQTAESLGVPVPDYAK